MKIFVALTVVGLLSCSLATISPEQAKADVAAHIEPQIFNLLSIPNIARAGGGVKCYDKYIPLITAATENSKTDTEACISRAASRREDELNKVKSERESLDGQVQNVADTLSVCLKKTDDLEYLKCLKDNSANLQVTINDVGKTSSSLSDNLSSSYKNIDSTEDSCVKTVIAKSKSVSDELLAALQNCLMNGLDDGSDGGSDGGSNGDSDGGSDGGSNGGSDSGNNGGSDSGNNGGSDSGNNGGSDSGNNGGSDSGNNGGSDSGSNGGSDSGNNGGSDSGSNNGDSDGSDSGNNSDSNDGGSDGSDSGNNGGSNNGNNGDSNSGGSDSGNNGGSDASSNNGNNNGSDSDSNGNGNNADPGVVPDNNLQPQEDLSNA